MKKNILCFTPGLDSFLSDWILQKNDIEYQRVYVDLQGMYNQHELDFLYEKRGKEYFEVINNLSIDGLEHKDAHVPNRNLLLVSLVQGKYNADNVYLSGVKDDRVSDNNPEFYNQASSILSQCSEKPVKVSSLLYTKEKAEWCKEYVDFGNDWRTLFTNTYSCFNNKATKQEVPIYHYNDGVPEVVDTLEIYGCLSCSACYRRLSALSYLNKFVIFEDYDLAINYPSKIDPNIHPYRYQAAVKFAEFQRRVRGI